MVRKNDPDKSTDRVWVPQNIAWDLVKKVHLFLLHFGTDKVIYFVKTYFVVENLDRIVRDVVASVAIVLRRNIIRGLR